MLQFTECIEHDLSRRARQALEKLGCRSDERQVARWERECHLASNLDARWTSTNNHLLCDAIMVRARVLSLSLSRSMFGHLLRTACLAVARASVLASRLSELQESYTFGPGTTTTIQLSGQVGVPHTTLVLRPTDLETTLHNCFPSQRRGSRSCSCAQA